MSEWVSEWVSEWLTDWSTYKIVSYNEKEYSMSAVWWVQCEYSMSAVWVQCENNVMWCSVSAVSTVWVAHILVEQGQEQGTYDSCWLESFHRIGYHIVRKGRFVNFLVRCEYGVSTVWVRCEYGVSTVWVKYEWSAKCSVSTVWVQYECSMSAVWVQCVQQISSLVSVASLKSWEFSVSWVQAVHLFGEIAITVFVLSYYWVSTELVLS